MKTLTWRAALITLGALCGFSLALYALGSAAFILILAFGAAYLVFPWIRWLEARGIPRLAAVLVLFIAIIVGASVLGTWVLPKLLSELQSFVVMFPLYAGKALTKLKEILATYRLTLPFEISDWPQFINEHLSELFQNIALPVAKTFGNLVSSLTSLLIAAMGLALFPIFFFYLILDYEKLLESARSLIPHSWRKRVLHYFSALDDILAGFIRGQFLVCVCLGLLYGIGLHLVGIPFGFVIGLIGGGLSFIPYVGGAFCLLTSMAIALASALDWTLYLGVGIVFAIVQSLESFWITPKLVGNRVGLSPLLAILCLIAGANLFGFWGLLVAIPFGGFLKVLLSDLVGLYKKSMFYRSP